MMAKYFIWKKFSIQVIRHAKNDFHTTSTTASNFKQSKTWCIFEKFSNWKLKPAPTQDKFLDFLQNEFSHSKCFWKVFFLLNCEGRFALTRAWIDAHPQSSEKKAFYNHFEYENSFCKKSRNLSWVGSGFSFKWLNFSENT